MADDTTPSTNSIAVTVCLALDYSNGYEIVSRHRRNVIPKYEFPRYETSLPPHYFVPPDQTYTIFPTSKYQDLCDWMKTLSPLCEKFYVLYLQINIDLLRKSKEKGHKRYLFITDKNFVATDEGLWCWAIAEIPPLQSDYNHIVDSLFKIKEFCDLEGPNAIFSVGMHVYFGALPVNPDVLFSYERCPHEWVNVQNTEPSPFCFYDLATKLIEDTKK